MIRPNNMQSQLAAALMGHNSIPNVPSTSTNEDEDKDEVEEEADEIDDDIDEENELENDSRSGKVSTAPTGRTITLQMLLDADILQPGKGTMSIEYLGQKFTGDLLPDGKIKSRETDLVFASPSAWAIHCKRIINPDKKSGCGWASVKYKGRKLDAYKNTWFKKKKELQQDKEEEPSEEEIEPENDTKLMAAPAPVQRIVMKHNTVQNRTYTHDANTLIECVPFSSLGKIQPFLVSMSTNACLLMDFHCHLTMSEVTGYLAGQWDVNAHNLSITHAFPCRITKSDRDLACFVEKEIQDAIEQQKLLLVGWYHSHPSTVATPTLRDIDSQLEYQIRMKGNSDSSYSPCIGVICSPYNSDTGLLESSIISYWVIPPPENKPFEYGRPMLMSYSVVQDSALTPFFIDEMKKCSEYYQKEKDFINFNEKYNSVITYLEKLKTTLTSKFPRDLSDRILWNYIRELVGFPGEEKTDPTCLLTPTPAISISCAPKTSTPNPPTSNPSPVPSMTSATPLSSNLMLTTDFASVLFQTGKFPSALLGIPDPMARTTLAANNMFLSPSLFKMQDTLNLLKPLSSSSPIASTSKSADLNLSASLKIPSEISLVKPPKVDFLPSELNIPASLSTLKTPKLDYSSSDFTHTTSTKPKIEFSASDLSISSVKPSKMDFSASDLSVSSAKTSNDIFSQMLDMSTKNKSDFSVADLTGSPAKMMKTDFPTLDLSMPTSKIGTADLSLVNQNQPLELSVNKIEEHNQPMSLTVTSENN